MGTELSVKSLTDMFKDKIAELGEEPELRWRTERIQYAMDENGEPCVKLGVGNVPLNYDLWTGLRNPAVVGLYPIGLKEIWEFHANRTKEKVDEFGRPTIFQIPRSFDLARHDYSRAVIVSVMLPFSPKIIRDYIQIIMENGGRSSHVFSRMYEDVNVLIDKATSRVAMDLVAEDTVVVTMDNDTVENVSKEAMPVTHQGSSHGPCKGGNYSQKSIAVLLGLGQFGVGRMVIRDELVDGRVQRSAGPIRSIILFDKKGLVKDASGGVLYPSEAWRGFLLRLFDFADTSPDINKFRFCRYIPDDDGSCAECIGSCPSGAQANSVPSPNGRYSSKISSQAHRFWEGKLQFDFARCCDKRGQMATLFPEWSCARCVSICAAEGNRRIHAAKHYYEKMLELTRD